MGVPEQISLFGLFRCLYERASQADLSFLLRNRLYISLQSEANFSFPFHFLK